MENEKETDPLIESLMETKKKLHEHRAKLPVEEKIKILVQLQELANEIGPSKGKGMVWKIF
ncbi:MAG TPA: hypothetical protein ENI73_02150 [Spirochaetes bacterium]|nr:hypothetical protein [Spirochaetota bacterium]